MDEYLNKGIKEIITQFPPVETILNEYDIGCAPCNVGSCLLRDIVEIHNLSEQDEEKLMSEIANVFYPGKVVEIPKIKKRGAPLSKDKKYSPPMKKLVNEHLLIKRLIALIPFIAETLDINKKSHQLLIRQCVDFIRSYADKFHHAKEEDILFKCFDESLDILTVMLTDHDTGRGHVRAILGAMDNGENEIVIHHLIQYAELLTEHIKKEDEILYPWMDRILDDRQIGKLYSQFSETDIQFGDAPKKYEEFIVDLEKKYKQ